MNQDPPELKETFDGYLMFDFSNFHGLMAQTFEEHEEALNESGSNHPAFNNTTRIRKPSDAPGPYISQKDYDNVDGDEADVIFDENDEFPDINLDDDDQCLSNLQNSEFNLLANLDFEPDDDAYENAMNLTGNDPSMQNVRQKTRAERHKKISIFSPTMHYEDNQELDKRIQMVNIQNIELLKDEQNLDDFYRFLRQLDFLNFYNLKTQEDHIKIEQLITMVQIRELFEKMCDIFQKWTQIMPSISFSSRLTVFQLQLNHFMNMVDYIIDNGTAKQKHFQPREEFHSIDQFIKQQQVSQQFNHSLLQKQGEILTPNVQSISHTLSLSVVFFKAHEMLEQYKTFLFFRNRSQQHKEIIKYFDLLKSRLRVHRLCKKADLTFFPRKQVNTQKPIHGRLSASLNEENINDHLMPTRNIDWHVDILSQKKIKGFDAYFTQYQASQPPRTIKTADNIIKNCVSRSTKEYLQLRSQRFSHNDYLTMSFVTENDY